MENTVAYMQDVIRRIHTHDRWFSYSENQKTIALVENLMRELGMVQVETLRFPSDGITKHNGWLMPLCWEAQKGTLELLLPDGEKQLICSYEQDPCSLMMYSHPADVDAELALPEDDDVKGKIVLFVHKNLSMDVVLEYLERGAVGFISALVGGAQVGQAGFEYLDDVYQWCHYRLPLWEVPQKPFGFSISPRKGRYLENMLKSGKPVKVHACLKTTLFQGTIPFVTGVLPGESEEEILLTGHLFEEGANDNASGVAECLAIIRSLSGKKRKRSIRLAFTNEARSFQAYLNNVKELPPIIAGINVDMVGCNLDDRGWIQDTDVVFPNFTVSLLEHCLKKQNLSAGILHYPDNDTGLFERGVPMTLVEFVNDANYHKSSDTPDKISPEFIARTFTAVREFTEILVNAGSRDAAFLAEIVSAYEREKSHFTGRETPRFACQRARKRLDSILRLVPLEEQNKTAELLEKYKEQFGKEETFAAAEYAGILSGFPKRLEHGLFSFERYIDRKKEYPETASLIRGWVAQDWVHHILAWSDGSRSTAEIMQLLCEAGFEIEVKLFNALLEFMISEGYMCMCSGRE